MSLQAVCKFSLLTFLINILVGIGNAQVKSNVTNTYKNEALPIVTISQGTLQGTTMTTRKNSSIFAFMGIPYAQPPIGNLRFRNPVAADTWDGTLDASAEGNYCPQPGGALGDEDCLYLNVYTPQLPEGNDSSLLPVMVYVHGGGFASSNGGPSIYGPGHLLDADLLLVSMNYRLGPLGFLSTGDEVASGNWGLKDQVLALQWVQDNIAYFGGDPDQVTLFGHSAGGSSVQHLALSNSTIGLFHKFISQSGSVFGFWSHRSRSACAKIARELGEFLGCPTNTSSLLVDCLRELNVSQVLNTDLFYSGEYAHPTLVWGPTSEPDIEGAFLTDTPANLLAAGKIRDLPSITGAVKDEALLFMPGTMENSGTFEEFIENFDDRLPFQLHYPSQVQDPANITAALKAFYLDDLTVDRDQLWYNCLKLFSDATIIYPIYTVHQKQFAFAKNPTYFYFFEYRGTHSYGEEFNSTDVLNTTVGHGDELLYLFPQLKTKFGVDPDEISETELQMIDTMTQLWTTFAINGTPTTSEIISNKTWLPYSSEDNYLRIGYGVDAILEIQYGFLVDRMNFWDKLLLDENLYPY